MNKNVILVHFKSVEDFRNRICGLWQDQKKNEIYDFTFENEEVEKHFIELMEAFV